MNRIVPHLWYDKEAKEAVLFYICLFEKSKLLNVTVLENICKHLAYILYPSSD